MRGGNAVKRGFTLIELLVAISIIAILMALLLRAVQQARESARRTECRNNLRQIGIALHNYYSAHDVLPPGCVGDANDPVNLQGWGWGVMLLPFLEQQNLFNEIDPNHNSLP